MRTVGFAVLAAGALVAAPFWLFMGMVIDSPVALWIGAVTQVVGGISLLAFIYNVWWPQPIVVHHADGVAGWPLTQDRRSLRSGR